MNRKPNSKNTRRSTSEHTPKDVYQEVTDRIVAALERGCVPWRKQWGSLEHHDAINLVTGKQYRGINRWLLNLDMFNDHRYLSYRQAQELGGNVRKGERASLIVFYSEVLVNEKDETGEYTGEKVNVRMLKYSHVFNVTQCDGLDIPEVPSKTPRNDNQVIELADSVYQNYPNRPTLSHGGDRAFYRPSTDHVTMPDMSLFDSSESYYSVLWHELVHSSGHESRLARKDLMESNGFGSVPYAREELVAELGSACLCAEIGIDNDILFDNATAYLQGWLSALKNDKKLIVKASGLASSACDLIMGRKEVVQ